MTEHRCVNCGEKMIRAAHKRLWQKHCEKCLAENKIKTYALDIRCPTCGADLFAVNIRQIGWSHKAVVECIGRGAHAFVIDVMIQGFNKGDPRLPIEKVS